MTVINAVRAMKKVIGPLPPQLMKKDVPYTSVRGPQCFAMKIGLLNQLLFTRLPSVIAYYTATIVLEGQIATERVIWTIWTQ